MFEGTDYNKLDQAIHPKKEVTDLGELEAALEVAEQEDLEVAQVVEA
jgi:hypothetical protein